MSRILTELSKLRLTVSRLTESIKTSEDRLITVSEAGKLLGWKTSTMYEKIYNGEIKAFRDGNRLKLSYSYVKSLVEEKKAS